MTERTSISYRLAVSPCQYGPDLRGLILWERTPHTSDWKALATIRPPVHTIDFDTLTVTPSIVVGSLHGHLTNGEWTPA